jgi:hypothetical protein
VLTSIGWGTLFVIGAVGWMVFWFGVHLSRALLRRRGRRLAGELGLQVGVSGKRARRGGEVEALVTISSTKGLGDVDVGLVCTESYDEEETDSEGKGTYRRTSHAVAHESWVPVESLAGVQSARLTIPAEAPFSYAGSCLSFKWEVAARGRRAGHVDAQARSEISVLP